MLALFLPFELRHYLIIIISHLFTFSQVAAVSLIIALILLLSLDQWERELYNKHFQTELR